MKRWMTILLIGVMMLSLAACESSNNKSTKSAAQTAKNNETMKTTESMKSVNETIKTTESTKPAVNKEESNVGNNKVLVVYFSREGSSYITPGVDATSSASLAVGNTTIIANQIKEITGGDIFQIVTVDPYPEDYRKTTYVADDELKANARPKLSTHVENMDSYEAIFLGYPDWWGTLPMPVFTFLEEYDFSGKTIIPFCTHEGSGLGRSLEDIKKLCPKSEILEGLAIRGGNAATEQAKKEVGAWLKRLVITK